MPARRREFVAGIALATVGTAGWTTAGRDPAGARTSDGSSGELTPENCESPDRSRDLTVLGDFESGLDGWGANGENELSRVTEDEVPMGAVSGGHALAVQVRGDAVPTIANEDRVARADVVDNPYLQMHVLAAATGTDSDLAYRFRLHHEVDCRNAGGPTGNEDPNVVESRDILGPRLWPRRIQWDMAEISEDVLATARRLEVTWQPADGGSTERGRETETSSTVDYGQLVVIDDIRLGADEPISDAERLQQKRMDLNREHGMIVDRTFEEQTETLERGTIEYADGYEAEYAFEDLDDGKFRYVLDGETYRLGNGTMVNPAEQGVETATSEQ